MELPRCSNGVVNQDVHAWTEKAREFVKNFSFTTEPMPYELLRTSLRNYVEMGGKNGAVTTKMVQRSDVDKDSATYIDPDLRLNIWQIWSVAFELSRINGSFDEFDETVNEMGNHCPQGDSHRLLMFISSQL